MHTGVVDAEGQGLQVGGVREQVVTEQFLVEHEILLSFALQAMAREDKS